MVLKGVEEMQRARPCLTSLLHPLVQECPFPKFKKKKKILHKKMLWQHHNDNVTLIVSLSFSPKKIFFECVCVGR